MVFMASQPHPHIVGKGLHLLGLLTLSAHAREGYSSHFVCQSVCHFSILEKAPFSGLKLTSVYILGDDLSPLNVALF